MSSMAIGTTSSARAANRDDRPPCSFAGPNPDASTVSVLLNQGAGTFAPKVAYATGLGPFSVAVRDFDGDGKPDLAVANISSNTVSVLLNKGAGTFTAKVDYGT